MLRRFGRRALPFRLGLAYPLARRGRTGLTVAMYALVVFILTFITAIAFMIDKQVETASANAAGGAQVYVKSSDANPIGVAALARTPGVLWSHRSSRSMRALRSKARTKTISVR